MHPPSPTGAQESPVAPTGVVHIIKDVRRMSLEDLRPGPRPGQLNVYTEYRSNGPSTGNCEGSPYFTADVHEAVHELSLFSRESGISPPRTPPPSAPATLAYDDLELRFPSNQSSPSMYLQPDNSPDTDSTSYSVVPGSQSAGQSPSAPQKLRERRKRRRLLTTTPRTAMSSLGGAIPSLGRRPYYNTSHPPPLSSFRISHKKGKAPIRPLPSDSIFIRPSMSSSGDNVLAAGYPANITELAALLGKRENAYPLWYLLLGFWFPEAEGYEIVNGWVPRAAGDELDTMFKSSTVRATLAVIWRGIAGDEDYDMRLAVGSPVVVLQVHEIPPNLHVSAPCIPSREPERLSTDNLTNAKNQNTLPMVIPPWNPSTAKALGQIQRLKENAKRSAEDLFAEAALYSELPTLCVLAVLGKTCWGGFVRSTDVTGSVAMQEWKEELGDWEWFGPGWEGDAAIDDIDEDIHGFGRKDVVSLEAFEMMGRCFSALKLNCESL
ncbi:hypothetical protein D9611_008859 [Ephemerocybe angulata]|uniref:Uncharacterized protein n=1 Tax=Ephemerocybe angulata TaxID=980116 RepID=A0A8H5FCD8_9AGAR|nr:hypothetical protein D9611_008859 [Tulosesus angulatus]